MDIIADIGGTHARFALVEGGELSAIKVFQRDNYRTFDAAVEDYLAGVGNPEITSMAVAWASLISSGTILHKLQKKDWHFTRNMLIEKFRLSRLHLINDTQAIGLSLQTMDEHDIFPLNRGRVVPRATNVVIALGTGFGTAMTIWDGDRRIVLAGEGGHAYLPVSRSAKGGTVQDYLRQRVSMLTIATVLSGTGLCNLYKAVAHIENRIIAFAPSPEQITEDALSGRDPIAAEAMRLFIESLAQVCHNLAITNLAAGGIYIAGTIVSALLPFFEKEEIAAMFMENPFPVSIITHAYPAFMGLKHTI